MNIRTFHASAALVNPVDRTHEAFQARSVVGGLWIKILAEELL